MSLQSTFLFLKGRLVSKSFVVLCSAATGLYLFDLGVEAYAQSTHFLPLEHAVNQIFGPGMITVTAVYLGALLEALGLSIMLGYGASKLRRRMRKT